MGMMRGDIRSRWCYGCVNHSEEIPTEFSDIAKLLSREYKYVIYCKVLNILVVANDNMWVDKTDRIFGCKEFKQP